MQKKNRKLKMRNRKTDLYSDEMWLRKREFVDFSSAAAKIVLKRDALSR